MTCPTCGYVMGALDKECSRCVVAARAGRNPYVAFQNQKHPAQELPAAVETISALDVPGAPSASFEKDDSDEEKPNGSRLSVKAAPFTPRGLGPTQEESNQGKHRVFWKALLAAALLLFLYHVSVVHEMQDKINSLAKSVNVQQKQIDSQQEQIDRLRDTVNYNAEAANESRF